MQGLTRLDENVEINYSILVMSAVVWSGVSGFHFYSFHAGISLMFRAEILIYP